MNQVIMIGRLTEEPDIRATAEGHLIARYKLAVNRWNDQADFFNCVCFGNTAKFAEDYLHKGTKIAITGELQNNHYEHNGVKRYEEQIVVRSHEFCESKKQNVQPDKNDNFVQPDVDEELPFN